MKRNILVLSVIVFMLTIFCLSGCENSAKVSIEDYQWEITTIQDNDNGAVVACSDDNTDLFPDVSEIDLFCTTDSKELTLINQTDNQIYSGTYAKDSSEPDSVIYSIQIGENSGMAICAWTTYQDGSKTPTLILSIGNYTLNFEGV